MDIPSVANFEAGMKKNGIRKKAQRRYCKVLPVEQYYLLKWETAVQRLLKIKGIFV
jgi:hypothetical protein